MEPVADATADLLLPVGMLSSMVPVARAPHPRRLHHPHRLVEYNHQVEVDEYPEGYYFSDDITTNRFAASRTTALVSSPRW